MNVPKRILVKGDEKTFPKLRDAVYFFQTTYLYDASQAANNYMGACVSSNDEFGKHIGAPIGIGRLIKGWDEGILTMSKGEKAILTISPDKGHGSEGFSDMIPPNSWLVSEITLLEIVRRKVNVESSS